jgi:all-trans-retinol 13,14-reductase
MRTPATCLILGSGVGGLALGALLARAGVRVTVLEAHPELIGGCAQTVHVNGYKFCTGPRYLWNFGPGQIGQRFLAKCALAERVPMAELDRRGFDHVYVGDHEPVLVPNGWSEYEELLKKRFPDEARGVERFFAWCRRAFRVFEVIDEHGLQADPWSRTLRKCFWRCPGPAASILLRPHLTLAEVFSHCGLGPHLRAVLYGHSGVFALSAERVSFYAYVGATLFYHRGCYYPVGDMEGLVGALAETIERRAGHVLRNQRVVSVRATPRGVEHVTTQTGDRHAAEAVVVNFDPRTFLGMIDHAAANRSPRVPDYKYSRSGTSLFLGVKDVSLMKRCLGKWNVWYVASADPMPDLYDAHPLDAPRALYLNSATLVKGVTNDAPPGHAAVTAFVPASYHAFAGVDPAAQEALKQRQTALTLDLVERRFLPGLRDALEVVHVRTPADKQRVWQAPEGNVYGRSIEPREVWKKAPIKGTLPGLYFVGSYVSYGGIASVIQGACRLYEELTGDRV